MNINRLNKEETLEINQSCILNPYLKIEPYVHKEILKYKKLEEHVTTQLKIGTLLINV